MAVREALLTLLSVEPNYGFRLHTELVARLPHRRGLNVGQSYSTIDRARKAGLVSSAGFTDDGLPLFQLTPAGVDVVRAWLAGTDGAGAAAEETAERVLLALSIGARLSDGLPTVTEILSSEHDRWQARSQHAAPTADALERSWNDLQSAAAQAVLHWLQSVQQQPAETFAREADIERPRRGRPRRRTDLTAPISS